jgi:hypothetical protein
MSSNARAKDAILIHRREHSGQILFTALLELRLQCDEREMKACSRESGETRAM